MQQDQLELPMQPPTDSHTSSRDASTGPAPPAAVQLPAISKIPSGGLVCLDPSRLPSHQMGVVINTVSRKGLKGTRLSHQHEPAPGRVERPPSALRQPQSRVNKLSPASSFHTPFYTNGRRLRDSSSQQALRGPPKVAGSYKTSSTSVLSLLTLLLILFTLLRSPTLHPSSRIGLLPGYGDSIVTYAPLYVSTTARRPTRHSIWCRPYLTSPSQIVSMPKHTKPGARHTTRVAGNATITTSFEGSSFVPRPADLELAQTHSLIVCDVHHPSGRLLRPDGHLSPNPYARIGLRYAPGPNTPVGPMVDFYHSEQGRKLIGLEPDDTSQALTGLLRSANFIQEKFSQSASKDTLQAGSSLSEPVGSPWTSPRLSEIAGAPQAGHSGDGNGLQVMVAGSVGPSTRPTSSSSVSVPAILPTVTHSTHTQRGLPAQSPVSAAVLAGPVAHPPRPILGPFEEVATNLGLSASDQREFQECLARQRRLVEELEAVGPSRHFLEVEALWAQFPVPNSPEVGLALALDPESQRLVDQWTKYTARAGFSELQDSVPAVAETLVTSTTLQPAHQAEEPIDASQDVSTQVWNAQITSGMATSSEAQLCQLPQAQPGASYHLTAMPTMEQMSSMSWGLQLSTGQQSVPLISGWPPSSIEPQPTQHPMAQPGMMQFPAGMATADQLVAFNPSGVQVPVHQPQMIHHPAGMPTAGQHMATEPSNGHAQAHRRRKVQRGPATPAQHWSAQTWQPQGAAVQPYTTQLPAEAPLPQTAMPSGHAAQPQTARQTLRPYPSVLLPPTPSHDVAYARGQNSSNYMSAGQPHFSGGITGPWYQH